MIINDLRRLAPVFAAASLIASCNGEAAAPRVTSVGVLELRLPGFHGELDRPAVEFGHLQHAQALEAEGCAVCHPSEEGRAPSWRFKRTADPTDRDDLMEHYHSACIGCHRERADQGSRGQAKAGQSKNGPVTCGECHVERPTATSSRVTPSWDLSLHARHSEAEGNRCETCHHVYDEQKRTLVYEKGAESACVDCHGDHDEGNKRAWRHAAHDACVGCHHKRAASGRESGPERCDGCHDAAAFAGVERLEDPPRLVRGQPDWRAIHTEGAKVEAVPFDHAHHEGVTRDCSTCHHQTLGKCSGCHTREGDAKGGLVTLEAAYHDADSEHSCVGCHKQETFQSTKCAGCHHVMPKEPSERTCAVCHRGGLVDAAAPTAVVDGMPASAPAPAAAGDPATAAAPAFGAPPALADPPEFGPDFPDMLELDHIKGPYEAGMLPHGPVGAALHEAVNNSRLARAFHGSTEVLCAGCHHHSPVGMRPPPCRSCHGDAAHATKDMPGLKAALHRQCIECHVEMEIGHVGCTDCHAEVKK